MGFWLIAMSFIIDYCYSNLIPLMMGALLVILGHIGWMKDLLLLLLLFSFFLGEQEVFWCYVLPSLIFY